MAPLKKVYLEELSRIQERVNHLFEQALLPADYDYEDAEGSLPGTWAPAVDVVETADAYHLYAELPGVRQESLHLKVRDRRLEISGRRDSLGENRNFLRMERAYGPFRRSFELAETVDAAALESHIQRGVLQIRLPKLNAAPREGSER